jgi:hypothetical protein
MNDYGPSSKDDRCDHEDTCTFREFVCANGHITKLSIQHRCPNPECDWIGKEHCEICGNKIKNWPDAPMMPLWKEYFNKKR